MLGDSGELEIVLWVLRCQRVQCWFRARQRASVLGKRRGLGAAVQGQEAARLSETAEVAADHLVIAFATAF